MKLKSTSRLFVALWNLRIDTMQISMRRDFHQHSYNESGADQGICGVVVEN